MGYRLHDFLFFTMCLTIGALLRSVLVGVGIYLALVYPVYRALKLFPMVLPKCPCCGKLPPGFHVQRSSWPRVPFQCPACDGTFVVWHNGKVGAEETWETPVLTLGWPYALGRYRRIQKPNSTDASHINLRG